MEYINKAIALIFAFVVIILAVKALRNALEFTDAGMFNLFVIIFFVIITVPPCRPYTEKSFLWCWNRLPTFITQEQPTVTNFDYAARNSRLLHRIQNNLYGNPCTAQSSGGTLKNIPIMAFSFVALLLYCIGGLIVLLLMALYYKILLPVSVILWSWYIIPPIFGFMAYDVINWAANTPLIGVPAVYFFAPFDSAFGRIRRKKMDSKLTGLRQDVIDKLDAIERAQNSPIAAIDASEFNNALNSSTLLTKWFRTWKVKTSSSLNKAAMESLTESINAYTNLLGAYDQLGMQQHKGKLMGARQELYEEELLAEAERIKTERVKYKKEQEVAELTRVEAEVDRKKAESELDKLRKKLDK